MNFNFKKKPQPEMRNSQLGEGFKKDLVSKSIFYFITIFIVFINSVYILIRGFQKGILKKEVLSTKSNLGFDIDIVIKSSQK